VNNENCNQKPRFGKSHASDEVVCNRLSTMVSFTQMNNGCEVSFKCIKLDVFV